MLTIHRAKQRFCYGISRRRFLKSGGFALNGGEGLTLVDVFAPKMPPSNVRPTRR